jgi:peroxiredoxin
MQRRTFLLGTTAAATAGALLGADIPRPAGDLTFNLINGQQARLSDYKGKVVACEFLLTWCQHCQQSSVVMEKLHREYAAKGFVALGLAINEDPDKRLTQQQLAAKFAKDYQLTYPVGVSSNEAMMRFMQIPMIGGRGAMMPQLAMIDRNGLVQAQFAGDDPFFQANEEASLRALIEKLMKASAPPKPAPAKSKKS